MTYFMGIHVKAYVIGMFLMGGSGIIFYVYPQTAYNTGVEPMNIITAIAVIAFLAGLLITIFSIAWGMVQPGGK